LRGKAARIAERSRDTSDAESAPAEAGVQEKAS